MLMISSLATKSSYSPSMLSTFDWPFNSIFYRPKTEWEISLTINSNTELGMRESDILYPWYVYNTLCCWLNLAKTLRFGTCFHPNHKGSFYDFSEMNWTQDWDTWYWDLWRRCPVKTADVCQSTQNVGKMLYDAPELYITWVNVQNRYLSIISCTSVINL